jgi:hypothetical protein
MDPFFFELLFPRGGLRLLRTGTISRFVVELLFLPVPARCKDEAALLCERSARVCLLVVRLALEAVFESLLFSYLGSIGLASLDERTELAFSRRCY